MSRVGGRDQELYHRTVPHPHEIRQSERDVEDELRIVRVGWNTLRSEGVGGATKCVQDVVVGRGVPCTTSRRMADSTRDCQGPSFLGNSEDLVTALPERYHEVLR